jgi:hypothetical protein
VGASVFGRELPVGFAVALQKMIVLNLRRPHSIWMTRATSNADHREFAFTHAEMSREEFASFNRVVKTSFR